MIGEPEHGRAVVGLVATDALEHPGAVVQTVDADVHVRVRPVDELAVHPDLLDPLHRYASLPWSQRSTATAHCRPSLIAQTIRD